MRLPIPRGVFTPAASLQVIRLPLDVATRPKFATRNVAATAEYLKLKMPRRAKNQGDSFS